MKSLTFDSKVGRPETQCLHKMTTLTVSIKLSIQGKLTWNRKREKSNHCNKQVPYIHKRCIISWILSYFISYMSNQTGSRGVREGRDQYLFCILYLQIFLPIFKTQNHAHNSNFSHSLWLTPFTSERAIRKLANLYKLQNSYTEYNIHSHFCS